MADITGWKSFYTIVPVFESIELAADLVYEVDPPPVDRDKFVTLMKLAVTEVHFTCLGKWFSQIDGVAMGSTLSVILANIWMHSFEKTLSLDIPIENGNNAVESFFLSEPVPGMWNKLNRNLECAYAVTFATHGSMGIVWD